MLKRKDACLKEKKTVLTKFLLAAITMVVIMGGTLTVSFANEDLNAVLTNWFDDKRNAAIVNIRDSISSEKDIQKKRLQDALKEEMAAAEIEMNQFTAEETARRIKNLRDYTDKLISGIEIDNSSEEQELTNQLSAIYAEAQKALNTANANWESSVVPVEKEEPAKPAEEAAKPEEPKVDDPAPEVETPVQPAPPENAVPPEQPAPEEGGAAIEVPAGDGE